MDVCTLPGMKQQLKKKGKNEWQNTCLSLKQIIVVFGLLTAIADIEEAVRRAAVLTSCEVVANS